MVGAFQQLMHLIGFSPYSIYGVAGSKRVEFCSKNKREGMVHVRSSSAEGSTAAHDKDGMVHGWRTETDLATWSSFDAFPAATREGSASGMLKYHAPTTRSSADSRKGASGLGFNRSAAAAGAALRTATGKRRRACSPSSAPKQGLPQAAAGGASKKINPTQSPAASVLWRRSRG